MPYYFPTRHDFGPLYAALRERGRIHDEMAAEAQRRVIGEELGSEERGSGTASKVPATDRFGAGDIGLRSSEPELDVSRARTHGAAGRASEDGHHWLSVERALGGSEGLSGDGAGSSSQGRDRAAPPLVRRGITG